MGKEKLIWSLIFFFKCINVCKKKYKTGLIGGMSGPGPDAGHMELLLFFPVKPVPGP